MAHSSTEQAAYGALVLAGGAARRLGGIDKPGIRVGESTLLERVLAACPRAHAVVVGPAREITGRAVVWAREDPPGGGPVAAIAAGLPHISAPVVLLLAGDLPFLAERSVERLVAALSQDGVEAAVLVDADGRDQPLVGAYRTAPLRAALQRLTAENGGQPAGLSLRRLVGALRVLRLADVDGASEDCDTWADVAAARRRESS